MGRPPCCDKVNVKRGPWTPEEDAKILAYVSRHGIGNWTHVPQKAGLNRCGKSCRLRWTNYLRPDLKHDNFTPQEEDCILELHRTVGSRWSLIAQQLPGRTDNDVKNYWNTKLKKKLFIMGIDPITHKPFSQIFSEFGMLSGLPNTKNQNAAAAATVGATQPTTLRWADSFQLNQEASHFQLINNQEPQHFPDEIEISSSYSSASSSSSSSSSNLVLFGSQPSRQLHLTPSSQTPPPPPAWNESIGHFLSSDVEQQVDDNVCPFPAHHLTRKGNNGMKDGPKGKAAAVPMGLEASASSSSSSVGGGDSFVESILARDSQMQLEFPQLLDGFSDYYY